MFHIIQAEIRCVMNGGDKDKENCAGNIIKTDTCENVDVKFQYQYCNWNADDLEERPDLKFIRKETWSKLRGEKQLPMLRTVLSPKKNAKSWLSIQQLVRAMIAQLQR